MSRRSSWGSTGGAVAAGVRPWRDSPRDRDSLRPTRDVAHPEPNHVERLSLRIIRIFVETWPALARAYPDRVDLFQARLEAELAGRPPRRRRAS